MNYLVFIAAILPVAILLYYIYKKDCKAPEPKKELTKAFFLGVFSVFLSLCISVPFGIMGLYTEQPSTFAGSISTAFFAAAIPEEIAKFIMLYLFLRNNKYYDEWIDGVVYAVCVSMGFAALENVLYLYNNYDSWLNVGIVRALFAVPGHYGFGIIVGYYFSLSRFGDGNNGRNLLLAILAPILAHGIYNSMLFLIGISPVACLLMLILFFIFCRKLWKDGKKKIEELLQKDALKENDKENIYQ